MFELLAEGAAGEHHEFVEPVAFGYITPPVAVALAMAVLLLILWRVGVPGMVAAALDSRIAQIRQQLDEAAKLRAEAEELKASYAKKIAAADGEIAELKASAEKQADEIVAKAKTEAAILVKRRKKMAEDKIAAAERDAIAEVKAKAVETATNASRKLIAEGHDADADKKLADAVISSI